MCAQRAPIVARQPVPCPSLPGHLRCIHHIGLRAHPLESTAPSNTRSYGRVPDEIVERLQAFYEPFNRELYDLLGWPDEKRWEPL
mmetsp:Transcript_17005/g.64795  ORF Transcript_17005/g.64795 Transcript_17005/m.64795 type:complete len:85 (-) Transcript_17005:1496-1750(-)